MANVKFCFPNWTLPSTVYTPTYSGAGWIDLPKLQGEVLSEMARYPGVNPANTILTFDLGTTRQIDVLALPFHNARLGDSARIQIANDAAYTDIVIDTGWNDFFGEIYPYGSLPWGSESWLDGRMTAEQAASAMPPWIYISPASVLGRYGRIYLNFSGNTDGYVDLSQVIVAPALTPRYNVSYGVAVPFYRDPSTKTRSRGGASFVDKQRAYRYTKMQLDWLAGDELYGQFFEFVRQYGVSTPFLFIYDSDAPAAYLPKQSFMAIAQTIGDPIRTHLDNHSLPIEICETF